MEIQVALTTIGGHIHGERRVHGPRTHTHHAGPPRVRRSQEAACDRGREGRVHQGPPDQARTARVKRARARCGYRACQLGEAWNPGPAPVAEWSEVTGV